MGIIDEALQTTAPASKGSIVDEAIANSFNPSADVSGGEPGSIVDAAIAAGTRFGKVMENLSRPNYAMAQGANAILEGKPVLPAMKKGWSLEEPMVFGDVIQRKMEKDAPQYLYEHPTASATIQTALGLVGDVALDPTTYLPGGISKIYSAVGKIPNVAKSVATARTVAKDAILGDKLIADTGKLFTNQVGSHVHREAYGILKKYEDLQGYRSGKAIDAAIELDKRVAKLAKETGEDLPALRERIIDSVEKRLITENPTMNEMVESLIAKNTEQLAAERAAGVATPELSQATGSAVDYFIHALSPEGKNWLEKNGGDGFKGISRNMTDTHVSMISRKYGDMGVKDVNDLMRSKGMTGDFFLVDPARAQAIRDVRSARAITGAEFYDEIGKTFGIDAKAPEAAGMVAAKPERLKGQVFPPEVAAVIDSHYDKFTNIKEINTVIRAYDAAHNWWKSWTLGIFPAYHARNMAGNFWNNALAGVRNPIVYKTAMDIQRGKSGVIKTALGDMSYDDVVKLAGERGILGRGFYAADIPSAIDDVVLKGRWLTLGRDNRVLRGGMKLGIAVENNARLAHFIDKLQKGMDADVAAKSVKKFLFDYGESTGFESNVMKRVFSFWSWSRKNLPLQLEYMVRKPGQQLLPVKLKHEIERLSNDDSPIPEANLPEWLVGDYPIRLPGRGPDEKDPSKTVQTYMPLAGYLPWGDLARSVNDPSGMAGFMVSPLIKEPVQQLANYDMYFKKPIANKELKQGTVIPKEGEDFTRFMGVKLTPRTAHVLRNIRLLASLHRANPLQIFGETTNDLGTGEKLSQYILGIRNYDVDEVSALVQGLYKEKRKMDGLKKDLALTSRELSKAEMHGKERAVQDAKDRMDIIVNAINRIGIEEVPRHIPR